VNLILAVKIRRRHLHGGMLGIALVVEDVTKGQKLAFRFPGPPSRLETEGFVEQEDSWQRRRSHAMPEPSRGASKVQSQRKDFWRFDADLFAKLLRPDHAQAQEGRMLELLVDSLRFLSFAVLTRRDSAPQDDDTSAAGTPTSTAEEEGNSGAGGNEQGDKEEDVADSEEQHSTHGSKHFLTLFSVIFILDAESEKLVEQSRMNLEIKPGYGTYGTNYPGSKEWIDMYRRAVVKLAHAMLYEETQHGYVSEQVRIMLNAAKATLFEPVPHDDVAAGPVLPERNGTNETHYESPAMTAPKSRVQSAKRMNKDELAHAIVDAMLEKSQLARELKEVFEGLSKFGNVDMALNSRVGLTLTLQNPLLHPNKPLRPYQALLLHSEFRHNPHISDSRTQLDRVAKYSLQYGPQKSFEEMSMALSIPLQEVFRVAAHLVYWRKARVIDAVMPENIYRVSQNADLDPCGVLHREFQNQLGEIFNTNFQSRKEQNDEGKIEVTKDETVNGFPKAGASFISLARILEAFSRGNKFGQPKTLKDIQDDLQRKWHIRQDEFSLMMTWLLQHELISRLRRFHYLLISYSNRENKPKKFRAGDTQSVGSYGVTAADAAAAAAQAENRANTAEALAAQALAEQTTHSTQSVQIHYAEQAVLGFHFDGPQALEGNVEPQSRTIKRPQQPQINQGQVLETAEVAFRRGLAKNEEDDQRANQEENTRQEIAYLDAIATESDTYRLFRRLAPYFHGRHHSDEIMWRENIPRDQFEQVLNNHSDVIASFLAPET